MKSLTTLILTKIGLAVSGPVGWVASLIIDKVIGIIVTLLYQAAKKVQDSIIESKNRKEETKAEEKYKDTLKDGANEKDQEQASTDVLNSGSNRP